MKNIFILICLAAILLLTGSVSAQSNNLTTFGTTQKVAICTEYTGAGELPVGAYFGGFTANNSNNLSIIGNAHGYVGNKLVLGYSSGTPGGAMNWYAGLELVNVSSGYGSLALMKTGGNVGIGTASPDTALRVWRKPGAGDAVIAITGGSCNTLYFSEGDTNNIALIKYDGNELRMGSNSADLLTFKSNNICIATTAPVSGYKLTVSGNTYVAGNGYFTGTVTTGSSRTLKKDIQDLSTQEAVDALKEIHPVKYRYKADESGALRLGFIAEDVPALVAEQDRRSLNDMNLVTLAITVIKQQQADIEILKKEIEELKKR